MTAKVAEKLNGGYGDVANRGSEYVIGKHPKAADSDDRADEEVPSKASDMTKGPAKDELEADTATVNHAHEKAGTMYKKATCHDNASLEN